MGTGLDTQPAVAGCGPMNPTMPLIEVAEISYGYINICVEKAGQAVGP
jgi:hypothetical protein